MRHLRTALVLATVAVTVVACSSKSATSPTTAATTTSAAATTVPGATSTIGAPSSTGAPATDVSTTATPTTAEATTAAPTTSIPVLSLYTKATGPTLPTTHTAAFSATGALPDGSYWAELTGGDAKGPTVSLVQAFFGKECVSKATEMGDTCENDIYLLTDPTREVSNLLYAPDALITVTDANTQQAYQVDGAELVFLRTTGPSAGAPKGYSYVPFGFYMTVKGGVITKFQQIWTP